MKRLLASDLDGTLIPLSRNPELLDAINDFSGIIALQPSLQLAYVTGRHFELTLQGIQEYGLPEPDFIVCDVGTSVYLKDSDKNWHPDKGYADFLSKRWNIFHASELADMLRGINGISIQEDFRQSAHKLSYYAPV
jgi:hydroxymethylpyrimidine pyrophosphatase-like HAD family hydrolase